MKTITMDFELYEKELEDCRWNEFNNGYSSGIESIAEFLASGKTFKQWWVDEDGGKLPSKGPWIVILKHLNRIKELHDEND